MFCVFKTETLVTVKFRVRCVCVCVCVCVCMPVCEHVIGWVGGCTCILLLHVWKYSFSVYESTLADLKQNKCLHTSEFISTSLLLTQHLLRDWIVSLSLQVFCLQPRIQRLEIRTINLKTNNFSPFVVVCFSLLRSKLCSSDIFLFFQNHVYII